MTVLLVADDDAEICLILKRILSRAGFTVLTAPDGETALHMAVTHTPDVVLSDLDMPGMTGLQLCQTLRRHPGLHDVPVALLSGSLHAGDPRAAEAHLCAVMLKPFTNTDLIATMQRLVVTGPHDHEQDASSCPLYAVA